jgi:hypothetical protein
VVELGAGGKVPGQPGPELVDTVVPAVPGPGRRQGPAAEDGRLGDPEW